eukprot:3693286-Pleurochrysis_carterae.AAC.1
MRSRCYTIAVNGRKPARVVDKVTEQCPCRQRARYAWCASPVLAVRNVSAGDAHRLHGVLAA